MKKQTTKIFGLLILSIVIFSVFFMTGKSLDQNYYMGYQNYERDGIDYIDGYSEDYGGLYTFNDGIPANFHYDSAEVSASVVSSVAGHTNVFKIGSMTNTGVGFNQINFVSVDFTENDHYFIEGWFYDGYADNSLCYISLYDSVNQKYGPSINLDVNDDLVPYGRIGSPRTYESNPNEVSGSRFIRTKSIWFSFRIEINKNSETFNVWINNNLMVSEHSNLIEGVQYNYDTILIGGRTDSGIYPLMSFCIDSLDISSMNPNYYPYSSQFANSEICPIHYNFTFESQTNQEITEGLTSTNPKEENDYTSRYSHINIETQKLKPPYSPLDHKIYLLPNSHTQNETMRGAITQWLLDTDLYDSEFNYEFLFSFQHRPNVVPIQYTNYLVKQTSQNTFKVWTSLGYLPYVVHTFTTTQRYVEISVNCYINQTRGLTTNFTLRESDSIHSESYTTQTFSNDENVSPDYISHFSSYFSLSKKSQGMLIATFPLIASRISNMHIVDNPESLFLANLDSEPDPYIVDYSLELPHWNYQSFSLESNENRTIYLSRNYTIVDGENSTTQQNFNFTYDFGLLEVSSIDKHYFYEEEFVNPQSLGNWIVSFGSLGSISFNWLRDGLAWVVNSIVFLFQFILYLLTLAFNYLLVFLLCWLIVLVWNYPIFFVVFAGIGIIFWIVYFFIWIWNWIVVLWKLVIEPLLTWIWNKTVAILRFLYNWLFKEGGLQTLVNLYLTLVSYILAAIFFVLTAGLINFTETQQALAVFLIQLNSLFFQIGSIFIENFPLLIGYSGVYILLVGLVYLKYIYAKARGYTQRATKLQSMINVYKLPMVLLIRLSQYILGFLQGGVPTDGADQ